MFHGLLVSWQHAQRLTYDDQSIQELTAYFY